MYWTVSVCARVRVRQPAIDVQLFLERSTIHKTPLVPSRSCHLNLSLKKTHLLEDIRISDQCVQYVIWRYSGIPNITWQYYSMSLHVNDTPCDNT